jgi:hypothetical protein
MAAINGDGGSSPTYGSVGIEAWNFIENDTST